MKKSLLVFACLGVTLAYSQNIKSENLEYTKTVFPTLIQLKKPLDLNILRISDSDFLKKAGLLNLNFGKVSFLNYNTSNPKYVAVLEYIYKDPYVFHEKKSLNTIVIKSNIEAKLYLIEIGKGIFDTEEIVLKNPQNSGTFKRGRYNEISSTISEVIADAEAAVYFKNGKFPNPEKVMEVESDQMLRISAIAERKINEKLADFEETAKMEFNYLKDDKNFDATTFNPIYEKVKQHLNPVDKVPLQKAISDFETEIEKYSGSSDKKIVKYREALLENIITLSYLIDDYQKAEIYQAQMETINPKNKQISWYIGAKKKFEKRQENTNLGKTPVYTSIPESLAALTQNKTNITQSGEVKDYKIEKTKASGYGEYMDATMDMNDLVFQFKAIQQKGLLLQYQNDIFNKIIWTMLMYDSHFDILKSSEKKIISDFLDFCKNFSKEVKEKKVYNTTDGKDVKLMKLREYVSQNYKVEDFTKFISSLEQAIMERTDNKSEETKIAYRAAINMNSIVQMRDLLADDNFMETERKSYEDQLDKVIESQLKNDVYYEFKKSIIVFDTIKNRRMLSKGEYENYRMLMNNVIAKFIYYI